MRLSMGAIPCGAAAAFILMSGSLAHGGDPVFIEGVTPYLSEADSPWALVAQEWNYFHLDDFETGLISTPGVSYSTGRIDTPGPFTDSVDFDDGLIDGYGQAGHSYFFTGVNDLWMTFDAEALGSLPTRAGLVWTDGGLDSTVTFEAYGPEQELLGLFEMLVGDNTLGGTTDEDRFFGVEFDGGISAIRLITNVQGVELDHVQYGSVPGPAGMAVLLGGLGLLGRGRRRTVR